MVSKFYYEIILITLFVFIAEKIEEKLNIIIVYLIN